MPYSVGKYAYGICDKTGFRYPLRELIPEIRNGSKTGMMVGYDVVDPDHPQNHLGKFSILSNAIFEFIFSSKSTST